MKSVANIGVSHSQNRGGDEVYLWLMVIQV